MDKEQAYNFFLKALTGKLLSTQRELDQTDINTPRYRILIDETVAIQKALTALDDLANLV